MLQVIYTIYIFVKLSNYNIREEFNLTCKNKCLNVSIKLSEKLLEVKDKYFSIFSIKYTL
jgi:hypothetical protein